MLFPMEPAEFWNHLKAIIEEVVDQKNNPISKQTSALDSPLKKLLKTKEVCEPFQVSNPTIYECFPPACIFDRTDLRIS
jgi:hypothetical protein